MNMKTHMAAIILLSSVIHAQDMPLSQVLQDDSPWTLVAEGLNFTEAPAVDRNGRLYFSDVPTGRIFRLNADHKPELFAENDGRTSGLMFGQDGLLYACHYRTRIVAAYQQNGEFKQVAALPSVNDLVVAANGLIYVTDPKSQAVWLVDSKGSWAPRKVAEGFKPNGIILWQDEGTLVVTDGAQPVLRTFRVETDGSLKYGDTYYSPLQTPFGEPVSQSDGMTVDEKHRLYVATSLGVQMFDPTGRLGGTISAPQRGFLSNVVFGGKDFKTLYATSADKVFARRVKAAGPPSILRHQNQ